MLKFRAGRRKGSSGAAIVESVLVMVVLLLILFGFLQLFQLSVAQVLCDFASFRAARSASVGFRDYLVRREAKLKVIPVSGVMQEPMSSSEFNSYSERLAYEKSEIPRYMTGEEYMEYERWNGDNTAYHTDYHCPFYGLPRSTAGGSGCLCRDSANHAHVSVHVSRTNESVKTTFLMQNFPLTLPLRDVFSSKSAFDLSSEVKLTNHASSILE